MRKQIPTCPKCGSDRVVATAHVYWDEDTWEIANVFDSDHWCDDCAENGRGGEIKSFNWITIFPEAKP